MLIAGANLETIDPTNYIWISPTILYSPAATHDYSHYRPFSFFRSCRLLLEITMVRPWLVAHHAAHEVRSLAFWCLARQTQAVFDVEITSNVEREPWMLHVDSIRFGRQFGNGANRFDDSITRRLGTSR